MACAGCSTARDVDGQPLGCRSNGNCGSGGCNRLNTYDWLSKREVRDVNPFHVVEVSFRNGTRKDFYFNPPGIGAFTSQQVVVDTGKGYDIGRITLSGELVRLQMRKKKVRPNANLKKVLRIANERDLERLDQARSREQETLVRARAITYAINSSMKISDVEYQADNRKATFYYTSEQRVDFRQLIREYANEFKIKIEMRQIGARQESGLIGGIGSCGRELCCSTWLTDFKSVSTSAARYQNLAINQAKLSGQCGRLKCCLNYELDTYMKAIKNFPRNVDKLRTEVGTAVLIKSDIFKGLMYYAYARSENRSGLFALEPDRVREIKEMNKKGEKPMDLTSFAYIPDVPVIAEEDREAEIDHDLTGVIELPPEERRRRKRNRGRKKPGGGGDRGKSGAAKTGNRSEKSDSGDKKEGGEKKPRSRNRRRGGKNAPKKTDGGTPPKGSSDKPKPPAGGDGSAPKKSSRRRRKRGPKKPPEG